MPMQPLGIAGAWVFEPTIHRDDRGEFLEWFQEQPFIEATGRPLRLAQANLSVSRRGVLRGIHYADVPPGQAKYVSCPRGAVLDVVVDIRVGSPTFGTWEVMQLDDFDRRALFIAEGLGHAFFALTDDASVAYACSEPYTPGSEHAVHPLDPAIGIAWPTDVATILSDKDAAAPTLAEAHEAGKLPMYDDCLAVYAH